MRTRPRVIEARVEKDMDVKTFQTVVGFHAGVWTADMIMSQLLHGSWSATLTVLPEGAGSVVALSMEGYFDDSRPALERQLKAQGFQIVLWSEVKIDKNRREVKSFSSETIKAEKPSPVQPLGVSCATVISTLAAVRTVLAAETGEILACSRVKKPRVSEIAGMIRIYLIED